MLRNRILVVSTPPPALARTAGLDNLCGLRSREWASRVGDEVIRLGDGGCLNLST